jgi:hypothetical protein
MVRWDDFRMARSGYERLCLFCAPAMLHAPIVQGLNGAGITCK